MLKVLWLAADVTEVETAETVADGSAFVELSGDLNSSVAVDGRLSSDVG